MQRPIVIRRLLVANRGEIAVRIISSARELGIHTVAIYTSDDPNHAVYADEAVSLQSPSDFTDRAKLVQICLDTKVDAVHPGYGFLSESPDFAQALEDANIVFVGPTTEILRQTGDKTTARAVAESCGVPVLPALRDPISSLDQATAFVQSIGLPVMIKAVDGGGGRGIRLISQPEGLSDGLNRACGESPSGKVFLEKAAVEGYRHVEVQIVGDNGGQVSHLGERECSIQRRFQKMVELAPSTIEDRGLIQRVIESAVKLASSINYTSLGTFEFLVHESRPEYYFLEINPRLQVEHTVTEQVYNIDLVRLQLLLAQGASIDDLDLSSHRPNAQANKAPNSFAIQLRITAEDPNNGFMLSKGRVTHFQSPGGRGVRVDSHLSGARISSVGSTYDSLLAKIIVTAPSFEEARLKGLRSLSDTVIRGVKTNVLVLMGVLASTDFRTRRCSTLWLEMNLPDIQKLGMELSAWCLSAKEASFPFLEKDASAGANAGGTSALMFKKGDSFKVKLEDALDAKPFGAMEFAVTLNRIMKNDFPTELHGDVTVHSADSAPKMFTGSISASTGGIALASSRHRRGDPSNPNHVILPFPGTVAEILVDVGDQVKEDEVLMVVRQMKMELEIRAPTAGMVSWVCDVHEGETMTEGMLVCELQTIAPASRARPTPKL